MATFALDIIEGIRGDQTFSKLIVNDSCQFDEFEKNLQNNPKYQAELASIYLYMEKVANGASLPKKKFRDVTPDKEKVKEYEFKSKNLRVYAIKCDNGKIIILGGFKNSQKKDYRKFRSIKSRYLESTE